MDTPIVIVGGGIGGLSTGIRLLHAGFPVSLFEKNSTIGGALSAFQSPDGRFCFQESASIGINPLTFFELFKDTQKIPSDYFQWEFLDTLYHVLRARQVSFDLPWDFSKMKHALAQLYPDDAEQYITFITNTSTSYLKAKNALLTQAFLTPMQSFHSQTLYHILQTAPYYTANHMIKRHIHDLSLQQLLLFQTFFMGISPTRMPSIYAAIPAQTQVEGIIHIRGGLYRYIQALVRLFQELGGKLFCNTPVSSIYIEKNKAKGILLKNTYIPASKVIVNADYLYTQSHLLPHRYLHGATQDHLTCSTVVIHLGLDCHLPKLHVHNLCASPVFHQEMHALLEGKLISTPSLYLYYPSAIDSSLCQNPHESVLNIMIRVPHLGFHTIKWDTQTKSKLYHLCLRLLHSHPTLSQIHKHIIYHHITTPTTYANRYHYTKGSCFGLAPTYTQSLMFRPQIVDPNFKNLYYVGSSIHPGNGASIVMDGAKLLANYLIHKNL